MGSYICCDINDETWLLLISNVSANGFRELCVTWTEELGVAAWARVAKICAFCVFSSLNSNNSHLILLFLLRVPLPITHWWFDYSTPTKVFVYPRLNQEL